MIKVISSLFLATVVFSIVSLSQNKQDKNILKKLVNNYSYRTIKALNRKSSIRFSETKRNTFYSDLDSDGDFDAIVEVFFCEKRNCHPTTGWSELIVYLRGQKGYSFAASKGYYIYGKINSIKQSRIYVDIYGFDEDDPQCCPQLKEEEILRLRGNKLVEVNN